MPPSSLAFQTRSCRATTAPLSTSIPRRIAGMKWLTLLVTVPATPTRYRVGVWRKLQRMGAVSLRGSAWLLPDTPETKELFEWLVQEVRTARGEATLLGVDRVETIREEQLAAMFHQARATDYEPIVRGCREVMTQLDRAKSAHRTSFTPIRAKLEAVKRELDRVQKIDYLDSPAGQKARELWERTSKRLTAVEAKPGRRAGQQPAGGLPVPGSTWVTRPRPHIDRLASAWLVRRFFDPEAKFAFAEPADATKKGIPFDILGAEFGHQGDDCTFETLVKRFAIKDRRVRVIAEIVHEADLGDGKFTRTESTGVDLAIRGLAEGVHDDHELLEQGMALFDGLYAVLKQKP